MNARNETCRVKRIADENREKYVGRQRDRGRDRDRKQREMKKKND